MTIERFDQWAMLVERREIGQAAVSSCQPVTEEERWVKYRAVGDQLVKLTAHMAAGPGEYQFVSNAQLPVLLGLMLQ
jgi:hypothetical protein